MSISTESRYQALFEPVKLGPVTAPNRFYQVPHCTGMGHVLPRTLAAMRGMKAEGGWGVVCTEYCSIHPSSDDLPYPFAALWDEGDVANLAAMAQQVHAHGALAGVELWHGGTYVANLASRLPSIGVRSMPSREEPRCSRNAWIAATSAPSVSGISPRPGVPGRPASILSTSTRRTVI